MAVQGACMRWMLLTELSVVTACGYDWQGVYDERWDGSAGMVARSGTPANEAGSPTISDVAGGGHSDAQGGVGGRGADPGVRGGEDSVSDGGACCRPTSCSAGSNGANTPGSERLK